MIKYIKNRKLILILAVSAVLLFSTGQPAHAFIGTGLFDWAMSAMGGLADLGGWAFALFFGVFIGLSVSSSLLAISAGLLEWSIMLPINIADNSLVRAGWDFTLGLANISFILILTGIALAFIFKQETLGMKKALPRLIIVALAVNFSLLLVSVFADVASVLQNTIIGAINPGGGLAQRTIETLSGGSANLISDLLVLLGTSVIMLAIPFADVGNMIARIGLSLFYLPNLITAFFLIFFNVVLSVIFLFYSALFAARIIIFWLLAISAPLAFIAAIVPATEKYWKQWLGALLSWTILGAIALFLITLGLRMMGSFVKNSALSVNPIQAWGNLREYFIYYFFITIYLIIALGISKKFAPAGAQMVWGLGEMAVKRGGKFTSEKMGSWGTQLAASRERRREEAAERVERGGTLTIRERMTTGVWTRRKEEAGRIKEAAGIKKKALEQKILAGEMKKIKQESAAELMKSLSDEERKPSRLRDRKKIAAISSKLLAGDAPIVGVYERLIPEAVRGGLDPNKILDARPDLAPGLGNLAPAPRRTVANAVESMGAETLRKQAQLNAYDNIEIARTILTDPSYAEEFVKNASRRVRERIVATAKAAPSLLGEPAVKERLNDPRWLFSRSEEEIKRTAAEAAAEEEEKKAREIREKLLAK